LSKQAILDFESMKKDDLPVQPWLYTEEAWALWKRPPWFLPNLAWCLWKWVHSLLTRWPSKGELWFP
jgi:hypothetical protein